MNRAIESRYEPTAEYLRERAARYLAHARRARNDKSSRAGNDKQEIHILLAFRRRGIATRGGQKAMKKKRIHVVIEGPHRAVSKEEIDATRMRGAPVIGEKRLSHHVGIVVRNNAGRVIKRQRRKLRLGIEWGGILRIKRRPRVRVVERRCTGSITDSSS